MLFWKVAPVVVERSSFRIGLGTLRAGAGLLVNSLVSMGELIGEGLATLRDVSGMDSGGSGAGLILDVKIFVI